jgi:hypothetical protein
MSSFVKHGNMPVFDAQVFKKILLEKGVCATEFVGNGHLAMYKEVPAEHMSAYLDSRPRLLHREALEQALKKARHETLDPIPIPCSTIDF